ncbi:porin family protein [Telmatobacter sp. DSM 110680]|uniref:Porin family protein n=1 Tax=Telmatobacter sp. DSM 110680 TaxID=3036704 RepID=A0AAU7DQF9_9BACT
MISVRYTTLAGRTALLCAGLAFSLGSASAQLSMTPESSSAVSAPAAESSSNALQLGADTDMPDLSALPAAPSPNGAGGGQYDNRSRGGGGGGGIRSHLTYEVGGGFNAPTSDSSPYITWGGNITVGAGYRFNKNLALMLEYQFIDDKVPGQIIAEAGATGGNDHIWSLTLDPVYDFNPKSSINFYATGGYGFYRKVTSFTDPQQQQYCTYFYCGVVTQNVTVGHFSSNQGGWNIGGGMSHRFGGWNGDGKMSIFAEARYLDVLSPAITTQPNGLGTTAVGADTKIIPVTVGLRF